jgi:two-component system sensor histidine kinase and response regulator WspE
MSNGFVNDPSLLSLFLRELEIHVDALSSGLLDFEKRGPETALIESLMRASHSIKGAARVLHLKIIEAVAHGLEDCFLASQQGTFDIREDQFDLYFSVIDSLTRLSQSGIDGFSASFKQEEVCLLEAADKLRSLLSGGGVALVPTKPVSAPSPVSSTNKDGSEEDASVRVSAQYLTRVMSLAAESLVETSRLDPFADSLARIKDNQEHLVSSLSAIEQLIPQGVEGDAAYAMLREVRQQEIENLDMIRALREHIYVYSSRNYILSDQLYQEVLAGRMRPLSDVLKGFPRMIRDLSQALGKRIEWKCVGADTPVDRDSLEKLEAPLNHLVRNACDHGIEQPDERKRTGKSPVGCLTLIAGHRGGMLMIELKDDGAGVDLERVRSRVIDRGLLKPERANALPADELFSFMFLPGFSTSDSVSTVSGRGVGLDVAKEVVESLGGNIEVQSELGGGTSFTIKLPVTRSVVRALLVNIGGELYAFPLSQIVSVLPDQDDFAAAASIQRIDAHKLFRVGDQASPLLDRSRILLKSESREYIFEVDSIVGESTLLVSPLDSRLGKVPCISAASQNDDGAVVLIIDVPDLLYVIDHDPFSQPLLARPTYVDGEKKRVLIVDDSITVREAEAKIIKGLGLDVEVAVDGMDAWEALSSGCFDLIITDLDMPRMTGLELLEKIARDPRYSRIPVVVLSYKERSEDRDRALALGAKYYVLKSEFEDGRLQACIREIFDI